MVRSERFLVDCEGTLEERLGVCIVALSTVQPGEVVEADGDGRMVNVQKIALPTFSEIERFLNIGFH